MRFLVTRGVIEIVLEVLAEVMVLDVVRSWNGAGMSYSSAYFTNETLNKVYGLTRVYARGASTCTKCTSRL